jgi:biotin carboxyl carrier protein
MKRALVLDHTTGEAVAEVTIETIVSTRGAIVMAGSSSGASNLPGAASATGRTRLEVVVDGWRFEFDVVDADRAALHAKAMKGRGAHTQHGPTEVRAIIPGRVLTVAVAAGDVVSAGQQLLAVEAMKMQNELRSPRDGTVERVWVSPGATVEPGDLLLVLA